MRLEWVEERTGCSGLASAHALRQQGVPRADSAPQMQTSMCVHTHTHTHIHTHTRAACIHHVHTQAHTQTHTKTDTCTHASTHGAYPCVHTPMHRHTYSRVDRKAHKPPTRKHVQAHRHTQCWRHHPHLTPASSGLLKALSHLRVGPHCLFCKPQRTRPLWTTTVSVSSRRSCQQILEP